jgi:hypothetical protein
MEPAAYDLFDLLYGENSCLPIPTLKVLFGTPTSGQFTQRLLLHILSVINDSFCDILILSLRFPLFHILTVFSF